MSGTEWLVAGAGLYLAVNLVIALVLHLHAERQAHLRHRAPDVLVHFVVLTFLAIPALLVVVAGALFGGAREGLRPTGAKPADARAA